MAEDNLFDMPPPKERFEVQSGGPKWTKFERLIPWVVLVECRSRVQYRAAMIALCHALNRVPRCKPERMEPECATIIEQITVTKGMSGKLVHVPLARKLLRGYRTGMPLTWAEYHQFLPSYIDNPREQPRIPLEDLMALLARDSVDAPMVQEAINVLTTKIDGYWKPSDDEVFSRNWEQLKKAIAKAVQTSSLVEWNALCKLALGNREPKTNVLDSTVAVGIDLED